ncbi:hypothetical protein AC623_14830 [Bacillus sp. FJAT-27231]|uniref:hypothetical protein n=1 Tax=Bacillus sp. FJAT-27231 TaxID=1679168 RepID=UPI00067082E5|nr:hypothetical protein [Bacillus sp. FJAT-27231]KMY55053.1 hypothetical protein AC623_14830 [Bacillus sp. FJAT-27231]
MQFLFDERLGISLPYSLKDWSEYSINEQEYILNEWEKIRGSIPDRIRELEKKINAKQANLEQEESFILSCRLNEEISDLASIINDLWLWFRTTPSLKNE